MRPREWVGYRRIPWFVMEWGYGADSRFRKCNGAMRTAAVRAVATIFCFSERITTVIQSTKGAQSLYSKLARQELILLTWFSFFLPCW